MLRPWSPACDVLRPCLLLGRAGGTAADTRGRGRAASHVLEYDAEVLRAVVAADVHEVGDTVIGELAVRGEEDHLGRAPGERLAELDRELRHREHLLVDPGPPFRIE